MSERKYYCICDSNCKFETMTKEQIIAAIAEATGNAPTSIDNSFITKVKESNTGGNVSFWIGTEAQYNAIAAAVDSTPFIARIDANGRLYVCKDDSVLSTLQQTVAKHESKGVFTNKPWILTSEQYGDQLPAAGTKGRIFFKKV